MARLPEGISRRGNSYRVELRNGIGPDGKPVRISKSFHDLERAKQFRVDTLGALSRRTYVKPTKWTVGGYLRSWLLVVKPTIKRRRTWDGYEQITNQRLIPEFDSLPLAELTAKQIREFYARSYDVAGKKVEGKVTGQTIEHWHAVLHRALKLAVKDGLIPFNPCDIIEKNERPAVIKREMRVFEPSEVVAVLDPLSYYYAALYTMVQAGMRPEELLAVAWRHVFLDPGYEMIKIDRTLYNKNGVVAYEEPKSVLSRRVIPLTADLAAFLRSYRAQREEIYFRGGSILGKEDLVFPSVNFLPMNESVLYRNFVRMLKKTGIPGAGPYDLRHTFASLMLREGCDIMTLQRLMGHYSAAFTIDNYGHLMKGMKEAGMAKLNGIIPAAALSGTESQIRYYRPNGITMKDGTIRASGGPSGLKKRVANDIIEDAVDA